MAKNDPEGEAVYREFLQVAPGVALKNWKELVDQLRDVPSARRRAGMGAELQRLYDVSDEARNVTVAVGDQYIWEPINSRIRMFTISIRGCPRLRPTGFVRLSSLEALALPPSEQLRQPRQGRHP